MESHSSSHSIKNLRICRNFVVKTVLKNCKIQVGNNNYDPYDIANVQVVEINLIHCPRNGLSLYQEYLQSWKLLQYVHVRSYWNQTLRIIATCTFSTEFGIKIWSLYREFLSVHALNEEVLKILTLNLDKYT